jgi:hypothetical protein
MNFFDVIASTPQGKAATAGYLILFVTVIGSIMYQNTRLSEAEKLTGLEVFLIVLMLLIAYVLAIYSINCMVVGQAAGVGCGVWAWVNAGVVLVFAIAVVVSALF